MGKFVKLCFIPLVALYLLTLIAGCQMQTLPKPEPLTAASPSPLPKKSETVPILVGPPCDESLNPQEKMKCITQRLQDGIEYYSGLIKSYPNNAKAYRIRGFGYRKLNQLDQALADADMAIELEPENAEGYVDRAATLRYLGRLDEALADLTKAVALDPKLVSAYDGRAAVYNTLGKFDLALSDANKAIELNPDFDLAYESRVTAYAGLGQNYKALADADKLIKLVPQQSRPYTLRASLYRRLGRFDESLSDSNKAIELASTGAELRLAYLQRAGIYGGDLGNFGKAVDDVTAVIELDPNRAEAFMLRAGAYFGMGQHDEEVLKDADRAIELLSTTPKPNPNVVSAAYLLRARTYLRIGSFQKSLDQATKSIEWNPKNPMAYSERGLAKLSLDRPQEALADFNKEIELKPTAMAYSNRGSVYLLLHQDARAQADFKKAISLGMPSQQVEEVKNRVLRAR